MSGFTVAAVVFGLIFLVELPDKTFVATLVLATRFRPLLVWLGVSAAFLVQTVVAVAVGGVLGALPRTPVEILALVMFLAGGYLLLRNAGRADEEEHETEEEFGEKAAQEAAKARSPWRTVLLCFSIIFVAEWGDLSQLLTASLVLKYQQPYAVFAGAFTALVVVSGLGALLGRALLTRLSLATLHRLGGAVCLVMAAVTAYQLLAG